ncbi:MAG TPA: amino acid adenylation domain-containing protein, partial [Gemmatimonadales bacterium]|nr:amino acid adenylation domain-containing protein [Gemmatimonadales bacterium]
SEGQELSYGELARQAAQLAQVLRAQGAHANSLVGILEEKGVGQVVAVLGTLMSGAAYLPLDPESPELRWGRLLEQAHVQLLITERDEDEAWWPAGVQRMSLAEVRRGPEAEANWRELATKGVGEDLAYVMYTSGSTGEPKGVMVSHRGLVNALAWSREHFALRRDDRAIAITALHHDMSVFDLLGVLGAGGTLVIPEGWAKLEPRRWVELLREHDVTIWNSVPAYMQMLVQYLEQEQGEAGSLRLVILGGDWIGVKLPEQVWRQWPGAQVVSVGGPTETTLWNIYHEVGPGESEGRSIAYGKPIANNRYYILDELLRERPVGVVGEMYCGGVGVSPGYWQDEERSRERFIEHPESGERLYRTGDLGRYLSGGAIEFMGRADDQVQVG